MHIYAKPLTTLTVYILISLPIATGLLYIGFRHGKRITKIIAGILVIFSFYGILSYTVLHRTPSANHTFVWTAAIGSEFIRELYMNALLYYPFGLSLTVLIGPWSVLIAFLLSVAIESWQYISGSGLAQGTDVIMNTLGAVIGAVPYVVYSRLSRTHPHKDE